MRVTLEVRKHDLKDGATVRITHKESCQREPRRKFMTYYTHLKTREILLNWWQESTGEVTNSHRFL